VSLYAREACSPAENSSESHVERGKELDRYFIHKFNVSSKLKISFSQTAASFLFLIAELEFSASCLGLLAV
jgi:hypothetical protein